DYFGPTPPPGRHGFCGGGGARDDPFPVWLRVVQDAAWHLRSARGVSPRRVAVVGWSLGGGLAVAAAAVGVRFGAIAAFSTAGFPEVVARVKRFPPTILRSGGSTD